MSEETEQRFEPLVQRWRQMIAVEHARMESESGDAALALMVAVGSWWMMHTEASGREAVDRVHELLEGIACGLVEDEGVDEAVVAEAMRQCWVNAVDEEDEA